MKKMYTKAKTLFETTLFIKAQPAQRARVTKNGAYYNKHYKDYINWLDSQFRQRFPELELDLDGLKAKKEIYRVSWLAVNPVAGADRDNIDKPILDALQKARLIGNDRQVVAGDLQIVHHKDFADRLQVKVEILKMPTKKELEKLLLDN